MGTVRIGDGACRFQQGGPTDLLGSPGLVMQSSRRMLGWLRSSWLDHRPERRRRPAAGSSLSEHPGQVAVRITAIPIRSQRP